MYELPQIVARRLSELSTRLLDQGALAEQAAERYFDLCTAPNAWSGPDYASNREAYGTSRARAELCLRVGNELAYIVAADNPVREGARSPR